MSPVIIDDHKSISLAELHSCGVRWASAFQERGCAGGRIAIYLEKSVACCCVAIGAMLSSSTFVDIAPWHKQHDLKRIIGVAKPNLIVTTPELRLNLSDVSPDDILTLPEVDELVIKETPLPSWESASPGGFCVLTSGSTGVAKVVVCPEVALLDAMPTFKNILRPGDRVGSFWLYYYLFCVLFNKSTVVTLSDQAFQDTRLLCEQVRKHGITVLFLTPTFLDVCLKNADGDDLATSFKNVHTVMLTGEKVPDELRAMFHKALPKARLLNIYSINETGDLALETPGAAGTFQLRDGVYTSVLSRDQRVPRGAVGQLHVHTKALYKEYWADDGEIKVPQHQLYATGDLVRWLGEGRIQFVRREASTHVKIRGFKVNPKVVETILLEHPQINSALCVATGANDQEARLEAAVHVNGDMPVLTERQLRTWLLERLPHYMVPTVFHLAESKLDGMKPTGTGKMRPVRQKTAIAFFNTLPVLTDPSFSESLPASHMVVAEAWRETLGMPLHGLHTDDHFFDFGGSLLLVALAKALEKRTMVTPWT